MYDILDNIPEETINCLDKGFVRILDVMPRLVNDKNITADSAIVQMARVSYGAGTKSINEDRGLIRYLMRNAHTSPFEGVEFKFHIKLPIFVMRQLVRHRHVNLNEVSGRYSILKDEFYYPKRDEVHYQSKSNKQGGEEPVVDALADYFLHELDNICIEDYAKYTKMLDEGISREQARMLLPLNLYTEIYWKIDLHNLFHFLALRCDHHAQYEIRIFADAVLKLITPLVPISVEAWNDYHPLRNAIKLTALEVNTIRDALNGQTVSILNSDNKREQAEWRTKALKLGLIVKE